MAGEGLSVEKIEDSRFGQEQGKERECRTEKKQIAYRLTAHHIAAAETVLNKGDRVELVPGPDGTVKILHTRRKIVKTGLERE